MDSLDGLSLVDREIWLAAVSEDRYALEFAPSTICADREIVLQAVRSDGHALEYASLALRDDKDIVLTSVRQGACAMTLGYASEGLRADKDVVLAAVGKVAPDGKPRVCSGMALQYASTFLQGDEAIVFAAVEANGEALQHASPALQEDRDVVLAAVAQSGSALAHASDSLRGDREVVEAAVAEAYVALRHVHTSAGAEDWYKALVLRLIAEDWDVAWLLANALPALRADLEVAAAKPKTNLEPQKVERMRAMNPDEIEVPVRRGEGGTNNVTFSLVVDTRLTTPEESLFEKDATDGGGAKASGRRPMFTSLMLRVRGATEVTRNC